MSARGAGDFLTRTTAILGALFILNSIGLAVLASVDRAPRAIDTSLVAPAAPVPSQLPPVPAIDGGNTAVPSAPAQQKQAVPAEGNRSEEHTSELQSLMRISYAVFFLKKKKTNTNIESGIN